VHSKKSIFVLLVLFIFIIAANNGEKSNVPQLDKSLETKEAIIWYLGHAGWAVKTKSHFLIFDYTEQVRKPAEPDLSKGYINPSEIKDQNVFVFVSHEHGDHFDQIIFEWEKSIRNITYIFGWQVVEEPKPNHICMVHPRETRRINDMEILTINHSFDGVPEVAYLIRVDGLVIYHSGDHGTWSEELNPIFKGNIDYLSSIEKGIDIAFISSFGSKDGTKAVNNGDLYTIEQLLPKFTFPMHRGSAEEHYKWFALEAEIAKAKTKVICAAKRGDSFFFQNGKIQ